MSLTLFYTSVSSSVKIKKDQEKITSYLESKKIPFKLVDISQNPEEKERMRQIVGNPTALPPQICRGETYCGDFEAFENAIEDESIDHFLKIK